MDALHTVISVVQIISIVVMVALILIQNGKGADLGASMGGGIGGGPMGPAGGATFLSRSTAIAATVFFASTLLLVYLSNNRSHALHKSAGQSVLAQVAQVAQVAQKPGSSASATATQGNTQASSMTRPAPLQIPGQ
jgi:preprotein translocase subunit SecG